MKRTLKILLLAVLASLLAVQAVCAEGKLVFERGKQVVLFEQDGVKLTLNGEVQDDGVMSVQLSGVLENKSGHSISVFYGARANGLVAEPVRAWQCERRRVEQQGEDVSVAAV